MPTATVTDAEVLPEDTLFRGALVKCEPVTRSWDDKFTGQRQSKEKWIWTFQVTDGEHTGKFAKGETFPTMRQGSLPFQWITALAGREPGPKEEINTDHYLGTACTFEVTQRSFTGKKGDQVTVAEVSNVYPANLTGSGEPPF